MRHSIMTALLLITSLLLPNVAHSQEDRQPISLIGLEIRLWPEFDNDDLLVITIGQLAPDVERPTTVEMTLPPGAEVNAVAEVMDNGIVVDAAHTQNGDTLEIEVSTGTYQVEYYLPVIAANGSGRSYDFSYTTDYAVENVIWQVQQPPSTGTLVLSRQAEVVTTDQFGFPTYLLANRNVAPGATLELSASYERSSEQLTREYLNEQAEIAHSGLDLDTGEAATPVITRQSAGQWMFYLGGAGLVITLMAVVAVSYWRKGNQAVVDHDQTEAVRQFCTECGAKLGANNEFCKQCGAKVG